MHRFPPRSALATAFAAALLAVALPFAAQAQSSAPPYETRMLRLAEILGAMHHLDTICAPGYSPEAEPKKAPEAGGTTGAEATDPAPAAGKTKPSDATGDTGDDDKAMTGAPVDKDAPPQGRWRELMGKLLAAENPDRARRRRYIDSFNRGYNGFAQVYRQCTPSAQRAIARYRDEGSRLVKEITSRYAR